MELIIQECGNLWNENNTIQGTLVNDWNELKNASTSPTCNGDTVHRQHLEQMKRAITDLWAQLRDRRATLVKKIHQGTQLLLQNELNVIYQLQFWKNKQKTAQIGAPFDQKDADLDRIHADFDRLFDHISELRKFSIWLIGKLEEKLPMNNQEEIQNFITHLTDVIEQLNMLYRTLIDRILLVSQQPEPVLKTQRKINPVELHFLAADKLGIRQQLDKATIWVDIVTEEVARQLCAGGDVNLTDIKTIGTLSNEKEKSIQNKKRQMTVQFGNSKLLNVERRAPSGVKGNQCSKKEQKYVLLFRCSPLKIEHIGEINLWTLSLPVVVSVHGSQDCELYLTIFWQRAFGSIDYHDGNEEDTLTVPWPHLSQAIVHQFMSFTGAKVPLSETAMEYVAEKLFGRPQIEDPRRETMFITLEQFAKVTMSDEVDFSCWEWLFAIMQLVKHKEVLEFWNNGWLIGFISKYEAMEKMKIVPDQTFLLRFSDRVKGAVSIAYVSDSVYANDHRERRTFHLHPLGASELHKLSLVERIHKLQDIQYLYQSQNNIEKEKVVRHFATINDQSSVSTSSAALGYVKAEIAVVVEQNAFAHAKNTPSPQPLSNGDMSQLGQSYSPVVDCSSDNMEVTSADDYPRDPVNRFDARATENAPWAGAVNVGDIRLPGVGTFFSKKYVEEPMPLLDVADVARALSS
uniref:SH2 domain-containing protein n=1 Tax=Plectus sambesii TaxID=2011161 RepID=A0A914X6T4_9BILA